MALAPSTSSLSLSEKLNPVSFYTPAPLPCSLLTERLELALPLNKKIPVPSSLNASQTFAMPLSTTHSSFTITRAYPTSSEEVFTAFSDPAKKRRWFAEGESFIVEEFKMDFHVGGAETSRYRVKAGTPLKEGTLLGNDTIYLDIVPNKRIILAYSMTLGDQRISASLATIELREHSGQTLLTFTEQGAFLEGADGPRIREDGWRQLLERLAKEFSS